MFAIINTELETLSANGDNGESNITICHEELINKSIELCNLLQYDFIFAPVSIFLAKFYNSIYNNKLE